MKDIFTQFGIEEFSNKLADKVIERGSDRIAESVVDKIKPLLTQNVGSNQNDKIINRTQAAKLLDVSESTLRRLYTNGPLKVYGKGTRHMRFKESEVLNALAKF